MKGKIFLLAVFVLLISLHSISAEIDLRITGSIADVSSIFYTETDPTSLIGYDGNDVIAPGHFPSGNSSRFYSTVAGNQLAIDSWPLTSVPRTIVLTYETSPAQTGTLNLAWTFSDPTYDAVISYCGTDSTCANPTNPLDMETSSSTTVSLLGTSVYFKLVISLGLYCGDGTCNNGETTQTCAQDCPVVGCSQFAPSCTAPADLTCGQTESKSNCAGSCSSTGTKCNSGYSCNNGVCLINPQCITNLDCGLNQQCVNNVCQAIPQCTTNLDCGAGQQCVSGTCQLTVPQICTPACTGTDQCENGQCVQGTPLPDNQVPANLPAGSGGGATGCQRSFICGAWGECAVSYDVTNLISGSQLSGERTRICSDKNNCFVNFEQKEQCTLKEEIDVRTKSWCNQNYTEVVSKTTGKVLARIKVLPDGRAANLNFNVEGEGTCAYCYDGIKNYDEEGVDCGGTSCVACGSQNVKRNFSLIGTVYGYIFPLLVFLLFALMLTYTLRFMIHYHEKSSETSLIRKYNQWKKEGYDVSVLDNNIESLHRRL